jgi:hypothetical protein
MWDGGYIDWILIGSGYLLALGLFYWLGGAERAAEAIRRWGGSTSLHDDSRRPAR